MQGKQLVSFVDINIYIERTHSAFMCEKLCTKLSSGKEEISYVAKNE